MSLARMGEIYRVAVLAVGLLAASAHAAGLGAIDVQSHLGQPLLATIPLFGAGQSEYANSCINGRIETMDGALIARPRIEMLRSGSSAVLSVGTSQAINEPVVNIRLALACDVAVHRDFQVLLDPVVLPPVQVNQREAALPALQTQVVSIPPSARKVESKPSSAPAGKMKSAPESASTASAAKSAVTEAKTDTIRPRRKPQPKTPVKTAAAPRNVLRLSGIEDAGDRAGSVLRLRLSDTLSMPTGEAYPKTLEEFQAEQALLAAASNQEEITHRARILVKAMQTEVEVLKTEISVMKVETERLKQQSQVEKAAMEAMRNSSLNWTIGIGAVILVCLAAIMWLLWRFIAMHKGVTQIPWNDLDTIQDLGSQETEFPTSRLHTTLFDASTIDGMTTEDTTSSQSGTPQRQMPAPHAETGGQAEQAFKAEEISDVMELVEAWTALNDPLKVLELLKPFSEVEQPQSPLPWLCLLDVYRALNDKGKYETILERIRSIFNVKLSPWNEQAGQEELRTLADFPHVAEQIMTLWNGDDIKPYLENLLRDNRDGTRDGFDLPVVRDILRLMALLDGPSGSRDEATPDPRVYAILFGPPRVTPGLMATQATRSDEAPSTATNRIRERPKYITPSYQRTLLERDTKEQEIVSEAADPAEINEVTREAIRAAAAGSEGAGAAGACTADATVEDAAPPSECRHDKDIASAASDTGLEQEDMSPMTIKLHLAIAYQHIGDKEGASLLLEEVIEDGNPEQSEQARRILKELA